MRKEFSMLDPVEIPMVEDNAAPAELTKYMMKQGKLFINDLPAVLAILQSNPVRQTYQRVFMSADVLNLVIVR